MINVIVMNIDELNNCSMMMEMSFDDVMDYSDNDGDDSGCESILATNGGKILLFFPVKCLVQELIKDG